MYHVYKLLDPNTNLPFYIGKGSGSVLTRLDDHIQESYKSVEEQTNQLKCNKIRSILLSNSVVPTELEFFEVEDDAFRREKELIEYYGRKINKTGILTNIASGGRNGGYVGKQVYQFDLDGNILKEFTSSVDASRNIGITSSAIWACMSPNKPNTQSGGYMWSRFSTLEQKHIDAVRQRKKQSKTIYKIDVFGNVVNTFSSVQDAAKHCNVNWYAIGSIVGSNHTCCNHFWSDSLKYEYEVILCETTNMNFFNIKQAADAYNISASAVGRHLQGKLKSVKTYKFKKISVFGNGVGT